MAENCGLSSRHDVEREDQNMIMKYLVGSLFLCASMHSFADHHKESEMSPNIAAAKAGYDAFASGDMEVWKSTHASNAVWTVLEGLPYAGTYVGPESVVKNVFAEIANLWPDFKVEPIAFYESGDKVFIHARMTAGGRKTETVHMATIKDGKYVEFTPFDNSGFMMSQVVK
jgi:ketosteroid isomerase-like protein